MEEQILCNKCGKNRPESYKCTCKHDDMYGNFVEEKKLTTALRTRLAESEKAKDNWIIKSQRYESQRDINIEAKNQARKELAELKHRFVSKHAWSVAITRTEEAEKELAESQEEISVVAEQRDLMAKDAAEAREELRREKNRREVAEVRWKNRQDAAQKAEQALEEERKAKEPCPSCDWESYESLLAQERTAKAIAEKGLAEERRKVFRQVLDNMKCHTMKTLRAWIIMLATEEKTNDRT